LEREREREKGDLNQTIELGCKGCGEIEKRRNWEERLGAGWAPYL
jgi:hypothetical protein